MHIDISEYDFDFPKSLIAQRAKEKGKSAILFVPKTKGELSKKKAEDLVDAILPGDCLVVNNTKVIPARLFGQKESGGKFEILLVRPRSDYDGVCWEAWIKPGKNFKLGAKRNVGGVDLEVVDILEDGSRVISFLCSYPEFEQLLERQGKVPLPPYIDRDADDADKEAYQSVFAKNNGAVAAPTASLHFSTEMMQNLRDKGVHIAEVTLHVGPGTFKPVEEENALDHPMHGEDYVLEQSQADIINQAKAAGGRIISVGTTSTRVLETIAAENGVLKAAFGTTHKYIYPGYQWKVVDALITNFHFPRTTLLLLVSAMASKERILEAYDYAVSQEMRLFSYGDGMFLH